MGKNNSKPKPQTPQTPSKFVDNEPLPPAPPPVPKKIPDGSTIKLETLEPTVKRILSESKVIHQQADILENSLKKGGYTSDARQFNTIRQYSDDIGTHTQFLLTGLVKLFNNK